MIILHIMNSIKYNGKISKINFLEHYDLRDDTNILFILKLINKMQLNENYSIKSIMKSMS